MSKQMTKAEFVAYMIEQSVRHMAALSATTEIKTFLGGKATAAKYGGKVIKKAKVTFNHSIEYEKAVKNKMVKFGLDPETFRAEEHLYIRRILTSDGKLSSMGYHKDDENKPLMERRLYLVTYIMQGCVKSNYEYADAHGNALNSASVHQDLYQHKNNKQADVGLLNTSEQVMYRAYSLDSVKALSFEGEQIVIV